MRNNAVAYWLAAAIIAAHVARILLAPEAQLGLFERFAVIPARFDAESPLAFQNPVHALAPLIGHMFLHGFPQGPATIGFLHLGMNMLVFLQVSPLLAARLEEEEPGGLKFLLLFAIAGICGALTHVAFNFGQVFLAVGASGAICGLYAAYLLAMGPTWRLALKDRRVLSAGFWFLAINVGLAAAARASGFLPIAWEAHLGGFIGGAAAYPFLAPKARLRRGPWG